MDTLNRDQYLNLAALPPTTRWGPWRFTNAGLKNVVADYLIEWKDLYDTTEILDWILHLSGKNLEVYGGPECVSGLVETLAEVLHLHRIRGHLHQHKNIPVDAVGLAKQYRQRLRMHNTPAA